VEVLLDNQFSKEKKSAVEKAMARREFIRKASRGTLVVALGGAVYYIADDRLTREARAQTRPDGRPRLPPGQRVIEKLRPMGGRQGDPAPGRYRLRVHGAVQDPEVFTFKDLLKMRVVKQSVDVHCVTAWSVLGATFVGVRVRDLAATCRVSPKAKHVIFEAAHGYTANVQIEDALADNAMVAWELDGEPLARPHGAPVRAVVPDLYFWKSAKWLTGIRFVERDQPGYWETRGYHNHACPWKEERYG